MTSRSAGDRVRAPAAPPAQPGGRQGDGLPRRLGVNVLVYYVTFGVGSIVGLATVPLLVHHLGTAGYGVWALVGSVVVYLELFELGFGAATTKLVAEDAKRRDDAAVRTLNTNVFVLAGFGLLATAVGIALAPVAVNWLGIPVALRSQAYVGLLIMTVAVSVSIPLDALGGALVAYERLDLVGISNLARGLAASVGGAIAAVLGGGIVGVTAVTAACGISAHYLRWRMLKRLMPGVRLSLRLVERRKLRATAHISGWFMLSDLTSVVITRLDLVVVGVMLDIRAVAIYSLALKLSQIALRALTPFTELFFPRASALSAQRDTGGLAALLVDGTRVSLAVVTPLMLVLAVLAKPALTAWLGHGFGDAVSVLVILALARGFASITETAWWMLGGAGYIKRTSSLSIVEAVVNLGSSIALAHVMGPAGVAAGSLIGVVCARLPIAFIVTGRFTGVSITWIARRAIVPHLPPVIVTCAFLLFAARIISPTAIPVLLAATGGLVLYFATYFFLGAASSERARVRYVLSKWRQRRRLYLRDELGAGVAPSPVKPCIPSTKVSVAAVCVCTFRRPIGLARFLERFAEVQPTDLVALDGDEVRVKLIIVDNEESGPRRQEVAAFRCRWPGDIEFVVEPRRGIAQARNSATRAALPDADVVIFVDDDEVPEPGWLYELISAQQRTGADVVVGRVVPYFEQPPPPWLLDGGFFKRPRYADGHPLHYGWTSNVAILKDVFTVTDPPFDERLGLAGGEDTFFFRQAYLAGRRIVWADRAVVTEYVPLSRCKTSWLLRREYRRGNTLSICVAWLEGSPLRRSKRAARAMLVFCAGFMTMLTAPARGRRALLKGAQRVCFAAGLVSGVTGHIYEEYGRTHGR